MATPLDRTIPMTMSPLADAEPAPDSSRTMVGLGADKALAIPEPPPTRRIRDRRASAGVPEPAPTRPTGHIATNDAATLREAALAPADQLEALDWEEDAHTRVQPPAEEELAASARSLTELAPLDDPDALDDKTLAREIPSGPSAASAGAPCADELDGDDLDEPADTAPNFKRTLMGMPAIGTPLTLDKPDLANAEVNAPAPSHSIEQKGPNATIIMAPGERAPWPQDTSVSSVVPTAAPSSAPVMIPRTSEPPAGRSFFSYVALLAAAVGVTAGVYFALPLLQDERPATTVVAQEAESAAPTDAASASSISTLVIDATASNVELWVGGVRKGSLPLEVTLPAGTHELELRREGEPPVVRTISIAPGEKLDLGTVDLDNAIDVGELTISWAPSDARILLVDLAGPEEPKRLSGPFPLTLDVPKTGFKLVVVKAGYYDFIYPIDLTAGAKDISVEMQPRSKAAGGHSAEDEPSSEVPSGDDSTPEAADEAPEQEVAVEAPSSSPDAPDAESKYAASLAAAEAAVSEPTAETGPPAAETPPEPDPTELVPDPGFGD